MAGAGPTLAGARRPLTRDVRVAAVSFPATAGEAAALLNAAWPAPALHYTPEYLRWEAGFPAVSGATSLAAAAMDDRRLVGFAGATPRRMCLAGAVLPVLLVSFVAVDPEYRGRGIAAELYSVLIGEIRRSPARAILTFALRDSPGLAALESAYRSAGLPGIDLGAYPTFARAIQGHHPATRRAEPPDLRQPPAATQAPGLLAELPDEDEWEHRLRDPRPSKAFSAAHGAATAIVAIADRRGKTALEPFGLLTSLFTVVEGGQSLLELGDAAAGWIGARATTLVAPNLVPLTEPERLNAGFRRLSGPMYVGRLYPLDAQDSLLRSATRTSASIT